MDLENVYLVTNRLKTATGEDVSNAEEALGIKFPDGYSEFVTDLGEGVFSDFVRVFMPYRVVEQYREYQNRWKKYFLWDDDCPPMRKKLVIESFIIADTLQGDELIYHPDKPKRLVVLPRHDETIFRAGDNLPNAIRWLCRSGELTAPINFGYFESLQKRERATFEGPGELVNAVKALEALGIHDHLRHVSEEEDELYEFFVSDFQGSVTLTADESNLTVWLTHDADAMVETLKRTIGCLEDLGLVRQPNKN